jgi:DNA-binding FadR family transcriptional regulator
VRLDRLRKLADCSAVLGPLDHQGLLEVAQAIPVSAANELDDDELLEQLGVDTTTAGITNLRHVRSATEKLAAEEIANRQKCEDFDSFKPLFVQVKKDLDSGMRQRRPFQTMAEIKKGEFFIVGGQIAYIPEVGEEFMTQYERRGC